MRAVTPAPVDRDTPAARPGLAARLLTAPPRPRPDGPVVLLAACLVLGAASLAVPAVLGYDPWAWLVWGREVTRGELSLAGGPSWKPLPVLVTSGLAVFGDAAPQLWLVLARAGGFLGLLLTFRLAARFAGAGAGAVAALALLLTPDTESRWVRHMLQGNVEPLTVGLCLWAVERHLDGRHGHAALLAGAAALLRPEAWPFLLLYAVWLSWRRPPRWWVVLPTLPAAPLLWFGGDWWASGDPLTGAHRAQVLDTGTAQRVLLAMDQIRDVVVAPVWAAAAVCVVVAAHRRVGAPVVLAAGALGWTAVVGAMTGVFGFGALSRFLAPPAAVLCVLAGIAVAWTVAAPHHVVLRVGVAALLAAVIVPFALPRAEWLPRQVVAAAERAQLAADLDRALARAGGRDAVLACGALAVDAGRVEVQQIRPGLAWALDVALARVGYGLGAAPGVAIARTGGATDTALAAQPAPTVRTLARTPGWTVYAQLCPR